MVYVTKIFRSVSQLVITEILFFFPNSALPIREGRNAAAAPWGGRRVHRTGRGVAGGRTRVTMAGEVREREGEAHRTILGPAVGMTTVGGGGALTYMPGIPPLPRGEGGAKGGREMAKRPHG